jgi:GNAT superfamily N-acetyltransferase
MARPDLVVSLDDQADGEAKAAAGAALYRHNVEQTGIADRLPIGASLSDPGTATVLGGLWGRTELGLLVLDMLFLPADLRGDGFGARLLAVVEAEARRRGCVRALVETSSFQAPGFYERHGYEEFGRVQFGIGGHARIFFRKRLIDDRAEPASSG